MAGAWEGRGLTIFQHHYLVHTGQAPIPVYHTVYVTDAPPWPFLNVVRRNFQHALPLAQQGALTPPRDDDSPRPRVAKLPYTTFVR